MLYLERIPGHVQGEKLEKVLRRHWFIFLQATFMYAVLLILPAIFFVIVVEGREWALLDVVRAPILLLLSAYYLFVWLALFNSILDQYLDIWLVTNRRIVNIEQNGLFSRTIAEQNLSRVQDVTSEVIGFLPTFLDYGNVYVQTAGTVEHFVFKQVPHPNKVVELVLKMMEQNKFVPGTISKQTVAEGIIKNTLLD